MEQNFAFRPFWNGEVRSSRPKSVLAGDGSEPFLDWLGRIGIAW